MNQTEIFAGESDLITVQRLHEVLGVSEQTLRAEILSGKIPACKIGRRWFIPKSRFIAYIESGSTR